MDESKLSILEAIADSILKKCKVYDLESEISLNYKTEATSRFANSQITQNVEENSISLALTLAKGKRFVSEKTTEISDQKLTALIANLNDNLEKGQDIPFYSGFVESSVKYPTLKMNSKFWDVEKRANVIADVVQLSEEINKNAKMAGTCSSEEAIYFFQSSNGRKNSFPFNINQFKVNTIVEKGSKRGYGQKELFWRNKEPKYSELTEQAIDVGTSTLNATHKEPGDYKVVLSQQAVADLLLFVQYMLLAGYFHGGQCFFSEIATQVFDDKLSIKDMPLETSLSRVSLAHDAEGVPRRNKVVINEGKVNFIPYSSFDAMQFLNDKSKVTGDSFEHNFALCTSFVQSAGSTNDSDLIHDVQNGLYVNRFWYGPTTARFILVSAII